MKGKTPMCPPGWKRRESGERAAQKGSPQNGNSRPPSWPARSTVGKRPCAVSVARGMCRGFESVVSGRPSSPSAFGGDPVHEAHPGAQQRDALRRVDPPPAALRHGEELEGHEQALLA